MATLFSRLLSSQRVGMDKAVVGKPDSNQNKTGINVTAAIFFDGTGNNRNNVAQRHMSQHNARFPHDRVLEEDGIPLTGSFEKYGSDPTNSFNGAYSNVSILEKMNRKRTLQEQQLSVYIEGIGTENDQDDDTRGSAFGRGPRGIKDKVLIGVGRIGEQIAKILEKRRNTYVSRIDIDVFGFSRGAAAARHFVSLLRDNQQPLSNRLGAPQASVVINFVGLFDTVASYGYGVGFDSVVRELGLDIRSIPNRVVHLTASNEYRQNFSLTDITSSLHTHAGYELALPGVHSDIGGGYTENDSETRVLRWEDREKLIYYGWYTEAQLHDSPRPVFDPESHQYIYTEHNLVGTRQELKWDYQFIPLRIMAEQAAPHMLLQPLSPAGRFRAYVIGERHPLATAQTAILAAVGGPGEMGRYWLRLPGDPKLPFEEAPVERRLSLGAEQIRHLRNQYLHRSASLGIQGISDGWVRKGMGERLENGKPHRLVFAG